jgi:phage terminase large subunit-like protein
VAVQTKVAVHPVTAYAQAVVASEQIAGPWVRAACARHLRDLEIGHERGLRFSEGAANHALDFFGLLHLSEGEFADKPFVLQPWQRFIVGSLFGWKGPDGYRRFRKAYIEIAKGNGKSPMAAAIGLYAIVADGEPGAEVYSAAVTRDQAGILWNDAKHMTEASPALLRVVTVNAHNLAVVPTNSYFRSVSSEGRTLDGKRVHFALIDEVHEHPSATVIDKMQAGTKGRRQPLVFEITNSGYDRLSVCYAHHEYSEKILSGVLEDDGWFAYVCGLDEGDDWQDEAVWPKANPNIGISVTWKYLREQVREAVGMPGKQNIVLRLNFCVWTSQDTRFLSMALWDECNAPVDLASLKGRTCYAALDLASTTDIAALTLVFPSDDEAPPDPDATPQTLEAEIDGEPDVALTDRTIYDVLAYFWVPGDNVEARVRRDRVPYDVWIRDGFITATEGNVIHYAAIRQKLDQLAQDYDIAEVGFDRWGATQLTQELQEMGMTVVPIGQGFASMSAPTKELLNLVLSKRLRHGGNPVLRWMADNVRVSQDAAGNLKPDKARSTQRIDGVVSLIMSLDRATRNAGSGKSVYEGERGLLVL